MRTSRLPQPLFTENGPRAVLLLHAYTGSSNDMRMLSRYLEKKGYTVYSPHFSGHGTLKPEDILQQTVYRWQQDTHEAIAFLKEKGYNQLAVFGLSLGGILAMDSLTSNIEGIIGGGFFCSPIFPVKNHVVENFSIYAEKVLEMAQGTSSERTVRLKKMHHDSIKQMSAIEEFSQNVANRLSHIDRPIFMAQAGQDEMIDATGIYQTVQQLNHVRVMFNWYPESGHVMTVGPQHKQLEQDVDYFLATLSWNEEIK